MTIERFMRECDEVFFWINEKGAFLTSEEFEQDVEYLEVDVLRIQFDEFQKDLQNLEDRVTELNTLADQLTEDDSTEETNIRLRQQNVNEAWDSLKNLSVLRQERQFDTHEILRLKRFYRDADETVALIEEKDIILSSDYYGQNISCDQAVKLNVEGVERGLAALEEKVETLSKEAVLLLEIHQDEACQIKSKQNVLVHSWGKLKGSTEKLTGSDESYDLQRFLANFKDLVSWIHDMENNISADDLAEDVASAEALVERHDEYKGKIDAREDNFRTTFENGQRLLDANHFAAEEIQDKLSTLRLEKTSLLQLWEEQKTLYECVKLQLFYRDIEHADNWMTKQEILMANDDLGESFDSIKSLMEKHDDFEKSLAAQEERIRMLDDFASRLIKSEHFAQDDVSAKRDQLLDRRKSLYETAANQRQMLEELIELHSLERNCDKSNKACISENPKTTPDESCLTNVQKLKNVEEEHHANKSRIYTMQQRCEQVIEESHFATETIRDIVDEMNRLWNASYSKTDEEVNRLKEDRQQQICNKNIENTESSLQEIQGQIDTEDYGKEHLHLQTEEKKLQNVEKDLTAHENSIHTIHDTCEQPIAKNASKNIRDIVDEITQLWNRLPSKTNGKVYKTKEDSQEQCVQRNIEYTDSSIQEMQGHCLPENYGTMEIATGASSKHRCKRMHVSKNKNEGINVRKRSTLQQMKETRDKIDLESLNKYKKRLSESTKPSDIIRRVLNGDIRLHEDIMRRIPSLQECYSIHEVGNIKLTPKDFIVVRDVLSTRHISPVTAEKAWVSDFSSSLLLTDLNGEKLDEVNYSRSSFGCHSPCDVDVLIFLSYDKTRIIKFRTTKYDGPILDLQVPQKTVRSIYSSPINGDILVGMGRLEEAKVIRYNNSGQEVHQIQYDNTKKSLYGDPIYITENNLNRDVCVSDFNKYAVVVVDRDRNHRFSYVGHPQGSQLWPIGITTDIHGHILVCDRKSNSVHITDKDGHFISFLHTKRQGIRRPTAISLDIQNKRLWIGEDSASVITVYRYESQDEHGID